MSKQSNLFWFILIVFFFSLPFPSIAYEGKIANLVFSETAILFQPVTGLLNLSVTLTDEDNMTVLTRKLTPEGITIRLSEFGILYNSFYKIDLTAETGNYTDVEATGDSGREPGKHKLKEIINQSEIFQIFEKKIIINNIIEN